ncbi:MAG: sigma-70 family RNA polymerase sigma factor [Clostridia bacterium]|nr:sigma-70 family RNA polymerase sigma factor [Clostridia bacterium]
MEDIRIIEMLFERDQDALEALSHKYSRLYQGIIRKILSDEGDVEECSGDVLLAVWNSIPPHRPDSLPAFLCKIARRIGIDKLRYNSRQKRNPGYVLMLSELGDCLPEKESIEEVDERSASIREVLTVFLRELDPETEILFVRRYLYFESVADLAKRFELAENRISVKLYRARKKLKKMLEKENVKI